MPVGGQGASQDEGRCGLRSLDREGHRFLPGRNPRKALLSQLSWFNGGSQIRVSLIDALPSAPAPVNRHRGPREHKAMPSPLWQTGPWGDPHVGPSSGRDLGTGPGDPTRRSAPALEGELSRERFENPCERLGRDSEADAGGEGTDRRQDQAPRVGGRVSLPTGSGLGAQRPALGPRQVLPGKDITPEMGGGLGGERPRLPGWGWNAFPGPRGPEPGCVPGRPSAKTTTRMAPR